MLDIISHLVLPYTRYSLCMLLSFDLIVLSSPILVVAIDIPLESAMYNCSCDKTCCGRYNLIFMIVYPCVLFIFMQSIGVSETNYFWTNLKGYPSLSGEDSCILVINTCLLAY